MEWVIKFEYTFSTTPNDEAGYGLRNKNNSFAKPFRRPTDPFLSLPQRANNGIGEFSQLPIWMRLRGFSAWGIQTGLFAAL